MMQRKKSTLGSRLRSVCYAINGLKIFFREEPNARIQALALILALLAGWLLQISAMEWICVLIVSAMVIATECINTSLENLADIVSPALHPGIKKVKDLAAAGVWIAALVAFITGLIIYLPKIIALC